MIYMIFPISVQNNLPRADSISHLASFYAPVYVIVLKFKVDGIKVYSGLLHPTKFISLSE